MSDQVIELPKKVTDFLLQCDKDLKQAISEYERVDRIITGLNLLKQNTILNFVKANELEDLDIVVNEDYTLTIKQPEATEANQNSD